jgi:hypothetical protein
MMDVYFEAQSHMFTCMNSGVRGRLRDMTQLTSVWPGRKGQDPRAADPVEQMSACNLLVF